MRFLLSLALLLIVTPALAQGPSQAHSFGGGTCVQQPVPCANSYNGSTDYVAAGNACVTSSFGYENSDGFFQSSGLDSNNCLVAKPNIIPKTSAVAIAPHCCLVKAANDQCVFHCDLVTAP